MTGKNNTATSLAPITREETGRVWHTNQAGKATSTVAYDTGEVNPTRRLTQQIPEPNHKEHAKQDTAKFKSYHPTQPQNQLKAGYPIQMRSETLQRRRAISYR